MSPHLFSFSQLLFVRTITCYRMNMALLNRHFLAQTSALEVR